jgi:hypothetical protein
MRRRFELERDDNPPLFDELMTFPNGTKRLNRPRTLAHEGLHTQLGGSYLPGELRGGAALNRGESDPR